MTPKLLLADDSITVQRVIALTFQGEGIDVIAVGDGDQAVDAIARERPQIVLADLSMPGRDGYAVAEYVKRSPELAATTRVVLLTGSAEPVEEARSRALGIDGVLSKPFEPHVATALVRRLLAEAPIPPAGDAGASGPAFQPVILEGGGAAPASPISGDAPTMPHVAAGGSMAGDAIAVDDYFRRLDEALATAGLATAPETATDLAAIAGLPPAAASTDAETLVMPRPVPAPPEPDAEEAGAPKLVDAFSALLDAEAGGGVVAGPVEMDGPPAPVPPPAVEWTPGGTTAPVEAAAETVLLQSVEVAEVEQAAVDVEAPAPAEAAPQAPPAEAATVLVAAPVPVVSAPPAALKADVAEPSALDGIDLDVFADAVAQKILHRLTDARIDAIVSERVLEIAERLVREEIERIKADAQ